jgi:hypothetical protein
MQSMHAGTAWLYNRFILVIMLLMGWCWLLGSHTVNGIVGSGCCVCLQ